MLKFILFLSLAVPSWASLANVYIAATSAGGDTGVDCANAHALTFFNTAGNWGSGAGQIGTTTNDTVVHLCGTVTATNGTTALTFQGSGTSGHPITLLFETGAILQAGYLAASGNGSGCGGGISICSKSFVTIDGGSNGIIRNTANGSVLTNQQLSTGVDAYFCTSCTVQNLAITNIYVHSGTETAIDETQMRAVAMTGSNNIISGNTIDKCGWCIFIPYQNGDSGLQILNNEVSNMGHGVMYATSGANSSTNTIISGNRFHDTTAWDTPGCGFHQDGIHFFGDTGSSMDTVYVSNNYFYGDWGSCPTGFVFTEGGGSSTPSHMKNLSFWNNVGILAPGAVVNTNGWFNFASGDSGVQYIVNNTMIGPSATDNTACFVMQNLSGLTFENNLIDRCGSPARIDSTTLTAANKNAYGTSCQNGGNCFVFNGSFTGSFSAWKTACSCDAASIQNNSLLLNADGSLQASSPAIALAIDLSSIATGSRSSLSSDTTKGNTRTAIARGSSWDTGAYQFAAAATISVNVITSPAGRSITVDGVSATAPQNYSWTASTSHTIAVTSPQTVSTTRYVWASWSDSGAVSHTVSPAVDTDYTATFTTQYQLTVAASGGGTVSISSGTSGDFYNSGTGLTLTPVPNPGKMFSSWSGDASGSTNPLSVTMSAAKSITANFTDSSVQITGINTTQTQATVNYTVSDKSACTVRVSQSSSYSPLANDVNSSLFANSNTEAGRSFVTGIGQIVRQDIIGKRTTDLALDGTGKSRALQSNSLYYIELACSSGASTASTTFTTKPVTPGFSSDDVPFNSSLPFNLAVPTIDYSSKTATYIDPMTGTLLRPLTFPGEVGAYYFTRTWAYTDFYSSVSGVWVNPANIINGSVGTFASSVTTGSVIFAPLDPRTVIDPTNNKYCGLGGYLSDCGIEDVGFTLIGGSVSSDAAIEVCISMDGGATCWSDVVPITLSSSTPVSQGLKFGTGSSPSAISAGWGTNKIIKKPMIPRWAIGDVVTGALTLTFEYDNANVIGTTYQSLGGFLDPTWVSGSKIYIEGSDPTCAHNLCTISAVTTAKTATLVENLTVTRKIVKSAVFGLRLRYVSGSAISVTFSNYALAMTDLRKLPAGGGTDQCAQQNETTSDGKSGFLCVFRTTDNAFSIPLFVTKDGEGRVQGVFKPLTSIPGYPSQDNPLSGVGGGPTPDVSVFPSKNVAIVYWPDASTGGAPPLRYCLWSVTFPSGGFLTQTGYGYQNQSGPSNTNYPTENVVWANLTRGSQGRDITTQLNGVSWFSAIGGTTRFGNPTFFGKVGQYFLFYLGLGGQDTLTAFFVFDSSGTLVNSFNSWNGALSSNVSPRISWTGIHNVESVGIPDTVGLSTDALPGFASGHEYSGPYQTTPTCLFKSGTCNANTSVPPTNDGSYDSNCPVNTFGYTDCIKFRTQRMPCRTSPTTQEKIESPCQWDATQASVFSQIIAVGDIFYDRGTVGTDSERLQILAVTDLGSGVFETTAARAAALSYCVPSNQSAGQKTHSNGWSVAMGTPRDTCDSGYIVANIGTSAVTEAPRADYGGSHLDVGNGDTTGNINVSISGQGLGDGITNNLPITSLSLPVTRQPLWSFAGSGNDGTLASITQSYPSIRGAIGNQTIFNYRHLNPGFGATDYPPNAVTIAGGVTAVLQGGTTSVYKINVLGTADYKKLPLHMFAGQYLIKDASTATTGNTITDATPWTGCQAYKADECRTGSSVGDTYLVVPQADLTTAANTNSWGQRAPVATWLTPYMGWITQTYTSDLFGDRTKRITMGGSMPGWHEGFSNARIMPDGSGVIYHNQFPGAERNLWWAKLDNVFTHGQYGIGFRAIPIQIPAMAGATQAHILFGYQEYGSNSQLYCKPRADTCIADGSSTTYDFAIGDNSTTWVTCTTGCTINVPALPNRTLMYKIVRANGGTILTTSQVKYISVN